MVLLNELLMDANEYGNPTFGYVCILQIAYSHIMILY